MHYFDHNATSPLCEVARRAWLEAVDRFPANPASAHRWGARSERALEEARERLAARLTVDPHQLLWTSGATESNNLLIHHVARSGEGPVWLSAIEHPCVLEAARYWLPHRHHLIPVTRDGDLDLNWVADRLKTERPDLVAVMAANNETGILPSWLTVAQLCRDHGVAFFTDAAQAIGKLDMKDLAIADYFSGCAHKFGGPVGVGFLRATGPLLPLLRGGPQEGGRRAGTQNLAGATACVAALEHRLSNLEALSPDQRALIRDRFEDQVKSAIRGVEVLGGGRRRLWNTSSLLMPPVDCRRRWVVRLDKLGFAVSTGSACASGRETVSHVLRAMGHDGVGERMLRISSGWETSESAWEELARALIATAAEFGV
ncbi:MAG: aminotransferase class V-fold PLP-dependent enzyme [Verrucomicrobiales bacterium]|nr:aminotransferase class V-fold PLP-dependent enzyme [Verrucomicrobiales bacterium]